MSPNAWTRTLRARTAPTPAAIDRVRRRLDLQLAPATPELAHLPGVDERSVRRVRARLRARSSAPGWAVRAVGLGLAGAALAMVAMVAGTVGGEAPRGERYLVGEGQHTLAPHVVADHAGQGRVVTGPDGVVIDWELGRLDLDVGPGGRVVVRTAEGEVRVEGAALTLERDALGTRVDVARGDARVGCAGDPAVAVGEGSGAECWPGTPGGLLNRARALREGGAEADAVLATVDRGLAAGAADGPVRGELLALRMSALVDAGRDAEALDTAEAAIAQAADPARALALRRTAARLALRLGDCGRARVHVEGLPGSAEERALLSACE